MSGELLLQIEEETGFTAFENENQGKIQFTFYGTSDKYSDFKALMADHAPNASIVYLMDTGESHMYSAFKNTWY